MSVPYMSGALKGWTKKRTATIVTQSIIDHETFESETNEILDINIQPMPARQVDRKPEGQRSWQWFSIIIKNGPYLNTDDVIIIDSLRYKIEKGNDWRASGFTKYEAIADYTEYLALNKATPEGYQKLTPDGLLKFVGAL